MPEKESQTTTSDTNLFLEEQEKLPGKIHLPRSYEEGKVARWGSFQVHLVNEEQLYPVEFMEDLYLHKMDWVEENFETGGGIRTYRIQRIFRGKPEEIFNNSSSIEPSTRLSGQRVTLDKMQGEEGVHTASNRFTLFEEQEHIVMPDTGIVFLPDKNVKIGDSWKVSSKEAANVLTRMKKENDLKGTARLVRVKKDDENTFALLDLRLRLSWPSQSNTFRYRAAISGYVVLSIDPLQIRSSHLSGPVRWTSDNKKGPTGEGGAKLGIYSFDLVEEMRN